ncbi:GntR family transcriptional regulator [Caloramator quimbayensis]|uniref:GntR family transcriptional regulator n=1 Tax=Caloramator quimbayensis TaxID=1147123 RepID=A0A1T4YHI0_9CLOT|nr:GntR family transcriptional regulator [Caloramator quimbayensis]SKB01239.1 GntR family transcriptional regulator [Caloramator quimbayensis]
MLDRYNYIPLYIQLKNELVEKIKNGIWKVGDKIPTEKELMDEYNVGRATVREALSKLVNEGYLYKKQGIGTFVARTQPSLGFEPLISLTYSLNARGINPKNIPVENIKMAPDKATLKRLKWKSQYDCYYIKRIRYAENIPIAVEESYFSTEYGNIGEKFDLTGSFAKMILKDLNLNIKKVEQVIVPRVPSIKEREILNINEDTLVLDLERWIYIQDKNEPFYYLNFIIPENIYMINL